MVRWFCGGGRHGTRLADSPSVIDTAGVSGVRFTVFDLHRPIPCKCKYLTLTHALSRTLIRDSQPIYLSTLSLANPGVAYALCVPYCVSLLCVHFCVSLPFFKVAVWFWDGTSSPRWGWDRLDFLYFFCAVSLEIFVVTPQQGP